MQYLGKLSRLLPPLRHRSVHKTPGRNSREADRRNSRETRSEYKASHYLSPTLATHGRARNAPRESERERRGEGEETKFVISSWQVTRGELGSFSRGSSSFHGLPGGNPVNLNADCTCTGQHTLLTTGFEPDAAQFARLKLLRRALFPLLTFPTARLFASRIIVNAIYRARLILFVRTNRGFNLALRGLECYAVGLWCVARTRP